MEYDIIFVMGELFFDHPLCGIAILKRLLEKHGYSVGIIQMPQTEEDVKQLGKPNLFFGVTSGAIDSMVRNYTPLKKLRKDDKNLDYNESVPDRAVIVYSNWIRHCFKDSIMVLGGTEASLRRFTHYDYWSNSLRKPILFDSRADILAFGAAEKQILEIAERIKNKKPLSGILGTCMITKSAPEGFTELPSFEDVSNSKEKFCDMQNLIANNKDLCQKIDNRYVVQYKIPKYTSKDLDEYYGLDFSREIPSKHLRGFEFSVVTHRGCIGECNFCALKLMAGNRIISRSEESILRELEKMTQLPYFKGNIDDFGGPSANMYGMDCDKCEEGHCLDCKQLDRSNKRLINLLRKARQIQGIKNVYVRSGVRFDLCTPEYIKDMAAFHIYDTLRIAPEHPNKEIKRLMNKDKGELKKFISEFAKTGTLKRLCFYYLACHPGSTMKEAAELASEVKRFHCEENVQVFTPTPMTVSTCMYYTSLDPKTGKNVYVPYTYQEKKQQKRLIYGELKRNEESRPSSHRKTKENEQTYEEFKKRNQFKRNRRRR